MARYRFSFKLKQNFSIWFWKILYVFSLLLSNVVWWYNHFIIPCYFVCMHSRGNWFAAGGIIFYSVVCSFYFSISEREPLHRTDNVFLYSQQYPFHFSWNLSWKYWLTLLWKYSIALLVYSVRHNFWKLTKCDWIHRFIEQCFVTQATL